MARYEIKETWLEELYTPAERYLNIKLNDIIESNNLLHKDALCFGELMYKGKVYSSFLNEGSDSAWYYTAYEVHPTLIDKMETYLVDAQELTEEHKTISRFLSIMLPKLPSMHEVKQLFGDNLYNLVREHYFMVDRPTLSDKDIHDLSVEYRPYIDIMRNRMIDNLLAKDLYNADN